MPNTRLNLGSSAKSGPRTFYSRSLHLPTLRSLVGAFAWHLGSVESAPVVFVTARWDRVMIEKGNRVMEVKPDGTVITGTSDDQDRLLQYADYTFTYTANGELVSKCQGSACQYFDYDVFGNLRNVILDNGIQIEYVIDGRNRRIGKKINGTLVQGLVYDDQLRIVAELDGNNQVVSRFIYADHINVPEIIEKGGKTYRILHDHLGSPRFVIDTQTGEVVQEIQYDSWGNIAYDSNPGFQPFGFAGGIYDTQTKLVRFGARDYDPQVGRWILQDPAGFAEPGFPNLYGYSLSDPQNFFDHSGLSTVWELCKFVWKGTQPIRSAFFASRIARCYAARSLCVMKGEAECAKRYRPECPAHKECLAWVNECCDQEFRDCVAPFPLNMLDAPDWSRCANVPYFGLCPRQKGPCAVH